ncbi:hypothetical protein LTS18_011786, partial [Coniosporium uncinatum]
PIPELDRDALWAALTDVAAFLRSKKLNITIIAVGGAVNTIFLQTRRSTHDVDFFSQGLSSKEVQLAQAAAQYAQGPSAQLQN